MSHLKRTGSAITKHRAAQLAAGLMLLTIFGAAVPIGARPAPEVPIAHAACGVSINCGLDNTVTSALNVLHYYDPAHTSQAVEPDTGETWAITATWSSDEPYSSCPCEDLVHASVSATVTWTDSVGWSVGCTGCDPVNGPIYSVSVCDTGSCGSHTGPDNGWAYKLTVDIEHTFGGIQCPIPLDEYNTDVYLSSVAYRTTAVDDGNSVNTGACTEGSAVSPTSQTWTQTDPLGFDCSFDCNASGPTVTIEYE